MIKKIILLTDYKNRFLSKYGDHPYRSGMDKALLKNIFKKMDVDVEYLQFTDIDFNTTNFKNKIVLYSSSEDIGFHYKSYIEDIILGMKLQNAFVIPDYKYLRANNNKVFMEVLRDIIGNPELSNLKSFKPGVVEDVYQKKTTLEKWSGYVLKSATGAMSSGVFLAKNYKELIQKSKKISKTKKIYFDIKDYIRKFYFKGYQPESKFRNKFIIQQFVPNLKNDWKILIFFDKYYIVERPVKSNDFRASGSGHKHYLFGSNANIPPGIFDFAKKIFSSFNEPFASIDIMYDGSVFYICEFQLLHFGTSGQVKSDCYFTEKDGQWAQINEKLPLERVYAESIVNHLKQIL